MTVLIVQRGASDCMIASIAMATGRPYGEVRDAGLRTRALGRDGTNKEQLILAELGLSGFFMISYRPPAISHDFFRDQAWGRRAILSVPSVNSRIPLHAVYWNGNTLFDPNRIVGDRYTDFDALQPEEMILFREVP